MQIQIKKSRIFFGIFLFVDNLANSYFLTKSTHQVVSHFCKDTIFKQITTNTGINIKTR